MMGRRSWRLQADNAMIAGKNADKAMIAEGGGGQRRR